MTPIGFGCSIAVPLASTMNSAESLDDNGILFGLVHGAVLILTIMCFVGFVLL